MAGSVNKVIIIGNLGSDPELKQLQGDNQVCTFSVATSESWKDKAGQKQEKTEWHRIVAWGQLAGLCAKYLAKGRKAYVEGKIETRKWTDEKSGQDRYVTEIKADQVVFIDSGHGGQQGGGGGQQGQGGGGQGAGSGQGGGQSGSGQADW